MEKKVKFDNGKITLPSDKKARKKFMSGLLGYAIYNITIDVKKIAVKLGYSEDYENFYIVNYIKNFFDYTFYPGSADPDYDLILIDKYMNHRQDDHKYHRIYSKIHKHARKYGIKSIKLLDVKRIDIECPFGASTDMRGSHILDWKLACHSSYSIERSRNISLWDFATAILKLKSHKFDNWYEAYWSFSKCTFEDGVMSLVVYGEHGS